MIKNKKFHLYDDFLLLASDMKIFKRTYFTSKRKKYFKIIKKYRMNKFEGLKFKNKTIKKALKKLNFY